MKIAFVCARSSPASLGGAEELVRVNANFLAKAGHDVTILTSYINEGSSKRLQHEEVIDGVRVLRFMQWRFEQFAWISHLFSVFRRPAIEAKSTQDVNPVIGNHSSFGLRSVLFGFCYRWLSWLFSPTLFCHILRSSYEIIHVVPFPHTHIWFATRAATIAKIPVVLSPAYHVELQGGVAWQLRYLAEKVARLVVFTEKERIDLAKLGIPADRIDIVPPGCEEVAREQGQGERFRKRYNLKDNPIVLFAGTKGYDKGIMHLIDAMVIVRQTHPEAVLVAIGRGPESLHREILAKLPNALSLGYVSSEEKKEAFDACTLFAMPSRGDSFGIVYVDAWLCRKPVIAARAGSVPWVVHEGVDGELVSFGDVQGIADKIIILLDDPVRCQKLGEQGYAFVMNNYVREVVVDKLIKSYNLCITSIKSVQKA